jgi:hypothetical protein
MHFRRKHADSDFSDELRFAEKLASIDVARKPAGWNSSKIIDPSRVRTEIKTWRPLPSAQMESHPAWWVVTRSLILLNDCAG